MESKLVSLELTNFKSFNHLLVDDLDEFSLIAIVGDNGQGKSNIIDAILYVFGINNLKTLRIKKLADLVYCSNSQEIAANSCKVKLKIKTNEDTNVFARVSSISGRNEYIFNETVVLQSDYLENLQISGANIAAHNFFILQGNIQQLINLTEKKMTTFLEVASGSDEFVPEHEKCLKICAKAADKVSLIRNDMHHYRRIDKKLRKQAGEDRQLAHFREQLDEQNELLALYTANYLTHKIEDARKELERETNKHEQLDIDIPNVNNQLEAELKKKEDIGKIIQKTKIKIAQCEAEYQPLEREKARLDHEIASLDKWDKSLIQEVENLRKAAENEKKALTNLSAAHQRQVTEKNNAGKVLIQRIVPTDADNSEYFEITERVKQRLADNGKLQSVPINLKLSQLRREHYAITEKMKLMEEMCQKWEPLSGDLENEITQKLGNLRLTETQTLRLIDEYINKFEEIPTKFETLLDDIEVDALLKEDAKRQQESNEMDKLTSCYSAYGKLGELVQPAGVRKWTEEHLFDSIVVDSFETALQCGQVLSATNDKVNQRFLPLDTLVYEEQSAALANVPDVVPVSSLLNFDDNIHAAVMHSCDNAVVVDDEAAAETFLTASNYQYKVFTRDGICFHPSGMISVDFPMHRARNVSVNIHSKIDDFTNDMEGLQSGINKIENQIHNQIQAFESKRELSDEVEKIAAVKHTHDFFNRIRVKCENELRTLQEMINELEADVVDSDEALKTIEAEEFQTFCKRFKLRNIEEYRICTEIPSNLDAYTAKINEIQTEIDRSKNEILRLKEDIDKRLEHLQTIEQSKAAANEKIEEIKTKMDSSQRDKINKLHKTCMEKLEANEQTINELRKHLTRLTHQQYLCKQQCEKVKNDEKVSEKKFQFHLRQCAEKNIMIPMEEDDPNAIDYQKLPTADRGRKTQKSYETRVKNFEEKINTIQTEIDKLQLTEDRLHDNTADVNINYKDAVAKLNNAVQDLRKAQEDVDRVAAQRKERLCKLLKFLEISLDQNYQKLMGPYNFAKILPLNVDAPYAAGISYMVTVNNKGFLRIKDLSTGEKTMAALALFYAMREYNPSAILLLDEVDSHLDSRNLHNLAAFLRNEYLDKQHTIVVTHKPETASQADALMSVVWVENNESHIVKYKF